MTSRGPSMRRAHVAGCAALVLVTSGAGLTGGSPAHAVDGPPLVQVDFDSLANGSPLTNTGSLDATVKISTSGGGAIIAGRDDAHGRASGSFALPIASKNPSAARFISRDR